MSHATAKNLMLKGLKDVEGFHDVIFKWDGDGKTVEMKKHKVVLCASSTIFRTQFLGELAQQQGNAVVGNIETILLKDFSSEAYILFFDLMYGEMEELKTVKGPRLLFQLLGIVEKYMVVQEIVGLVRKRMVDLEITKDNWASALETVLEFKDLEGFQEATGNLLAKVVERLTLDSVLPALQTVVQLSEGEEEMKQLILSKVVKTVVAYYPQDPTEFYIKLFHDHHSELGVLMQAVVAYKSQMCSNCLEPRDKCKDGQEFRVMDLKPFVGLRLFLNGWDFKFYSVTPEGNNSYKVLTLGKRSGSTELEQLGNYDYPGTFNMSGWRYKCK